MRLCSRRSGHDARADASEIRPLLRALLVSCWTDAGIVCCHGTCPPRPRQAQCVRSPSCDTDEAVEGVSDQYFVTTVRGVTLLRSEEFDLVDATGLAKLARAIAVVSEALIQTVFHDLSLSHATERRASSCSGQADDSGQWVPRLQATIIARQLRLSERRLRPLLQRSFPDAPLDDEIEQETPTHDESERKSTSGVSGSIGIAPR